MAGPADDGGDLVGDLNGSGAPPVANDPGALAAVNSGVQQTQAQSQQDAETERKQVQAEWSEYDAARAFDKSARIAFAKDRQYAAGLSDPSWASDANLIGSFIDIMTSFLYAQNPDVSCKAARTVGEQPDDDNTDFAETMELIVSRLWKLARLKKAARRQVRSALSVGQGWIKALIWSQKRPEPQTEKMLHDAEDQAARIQALATSLKEQNLDSTEQDLKSAELAEMIAGLRAKIMKSREYGLNTDFVRAEDIQVSLDVSAISDYLSAEWLSEDMYIPKVSLRARFPRLTEDDERTATAYYQRNVADSAKGDSLSNATGDHAPDGQFSRTTPNQTTAGGTETKPVEFVKVVEKWNRRDSNIFTMCEGVKRWCVEPYTPPQASNRFYPYFELEFFPVDGHRHPQSLSFRLRKLQDEYSACRSNQRLTRERSIPGLIFNRALVSPEDARKLEMSVIAEMSGIQLTDINLPIQNAIMAKPLPTINPALWDSSSIRMDMESISGVQEALQQTQASKQPKTATEAQIEQTGFASRTSADRDQLEEMLADLAEYTAECGIQEIDPVAAQRIAGPKAFWPYGMDVQDLLTMVSIDIMAGTSGKPNKQQDAQAWAQILPMLQKLMVQIRQTQGIDPSLAECLKNLLKESLKRLDDRLDLDKFIAQDPPPPPPPTPKPQPNISVNLKGVLPAMDAAAIGAQAAGLPPEAALLPAGAPHAILPGAPDHPGAHIADGEIPLHPHMPQPLPAVQKTPKDGGETQKPKA